MAKFEKHLIPLDKLELLAAWHGEPVTLGDFVHLNSGSPLGLVTHLENDQASVLWFSKQLQRTKIHSRCLKPCGAGKPQ